MSSADGGTPTKKRKAFSDPEDLDAKRRNIGNDAAQTAISIAAQEAAIRAAEIAKSLLAKGINGAAPPQFSSASVIAPPSSSLDPEALAKMAKAAELQKQLAAQIASVSSILNSVQSKAATAATAAAPEKKATNRALRLDALGREIDGHGNIVKTQVVKTLAANVAVELAQKKKENPYLAHRAPAALPVILPGNVPGVHVADSSATTAGVLGVAAASAAPNEIIDDRIMPSSRQARARKGLKFVEAGKYLQQADEIRSKEERKIIAGYASGRKAPELIQDESAKGGEETTEGGSSTLLDTLAAAPHNNSTQVGPPVPPPVDTVGTIPSVEWWDEAFLPKEIRELRKKSRAAAEEDDYPRAALTHTKTYKYIQHPVAIKPLGGEKPEQPLPMYLTKKERKRIRKQAREEREREKRDKMMMGLIPAPEPKFKLSNFMKVLGDQAIADPSKVELRVLQQMRQRQLNHEMRNLGAKLTPAERKAKRMQKLQEDTSRQVHVAAFRIKDFSDPKHRFKVDVNAQQHYLSGTVILCQSASAAAEGSSNSNGGGSNLVLVEGGPKGIRKFIKLMTKRIPWDSKVERSATTSATGTTQNQEEQWAEEEEAEMEDDGDDDNSDDEDGPNRDDGKETTNGGSTHQSSTGGYPFSTGGSEDGGDVSGGKGGEKNRCDLLWSGICAKRAFVGFKFQECRSAAVARKLLDAKGAAHYWDMCVRTSESVQQEIDDIM